MLVDYCCLRFSKADEVDYVGENFDESFPSRFIKVLKGKVLDSTLKQG